MPIDHRSGAVSRPSLNAAQQALETQARHLIDQDTEEPFFVCDLDHVTRRAEEWKASMPNVMPFYAVKCNPDERLIQHLASLGVSFDCASPAEMDLVLRQGVAPSRIVFANACKAKGAIRHAREHRVAKTTFDNSAELVKLADEFPAAQLILRIVADDETADSRLSDKFGASVSEAVDLLNLAKRLRLHVVGISFHVGSGAKQARVFAQAIRDARSAWLHARGLGFDMDVLDIGGGFTQATLAKFAPKINGALKLYFGDESCRVIAEPGRYFAEGAYTLACTVIAERPRSKPTESRGEMQRLYLNDGVFGNFANCVYEHAQYRPKMLYSDGSFFPGEGATSDFECSIWGPTCDSADCINKGVKLPFSTHVGDWLYFENMGAYSLACATGFNGFTGARRIIHIVSEKSSQERVFNPPR